MRMMKGGAIIKKLVEEASKALEHDLNRVEGARARNES